MLRGRQRMVNDVLDENSPAFGSLTTEQFWALEYNLPIAAYHAARCIEGAKFRWGTWAHAVRRQRRVGYHWDRQCA